MRPALVLAGGGVAGIAWELGVLQALRVAGIDLQEAPLVVGTSAGATVGAQLCTGYAELAFQAQHHAAPTELKVDLDLERFGEMFAELLGGSAGPEAMARIGRMALDAATVAEPVRRAVIESRLPDHEWPLQRLLLTAIDAHSGALRTFERDSGVALVDAVAASCAVPGIWPPVTIGDRRYVDGGVRSVTNADLATGHSRVVVLLPMARTGPVAERLATEVDILGHGSRVRVIAADEEAVAGFGANPLDPACRLPAVTAGARQGAAAAGDLQKFWASETH
jgi:NTE family protein